MHSNRGLAERPICARSCPPGQVAFRPERDLARPAACGTRLRQRWRRTTVRECLGRARLKTSCRRGSAEILDRAGHVSVAPAAATGAARDTELLTHAVARH